MTESRDDPRRVARFEWVVIAVLSLAAGIAWEIGRPLPDGISLHVQLTELNEHDRLVVPEPRIRALPVFRGDRMVAGESQQITRHVLELGVGGRFTLHGLSSNDRADPIELILNGRPVSYSAFWRNTGSRRADFERQWIRSGVRLETGSNRIVVRGKHLDRRTLFLELQPERPRSVLRMATIALLVAGLLVCRRFVVARLRLDPGWAAALSLGMAVAAPALLWWAAATTDGAALEAVGDPSPSRSAALAEFDRESREPAAIDRCRSTFCVAVFGDSTHFWALKPPERMLPRLRAALPADVFVWGVSAAGFSGYDYYFLAQHMVDRGVDLLVVPVSLRSFSPWWLETEGLRNTSVEDYLRWDEIPRALSLSVAGRSLDLSHWWLRRLDAGLFDGAGERVLRGLRVLAHAERKRLDDLAMTAQPFESSRGPEFVKLPGWPGPLTEHHELFDAFALLDAMTGRHAVQLLYYTVNVNEQAQAAAGNRLEVAAQYELIRGVLEGSEHVTFLDLGRENPPQLFHDALDHLSPEGMQLVSERIAAAVESIRSTR